MNAKEMFEQLGFIKNTSTCYNEKHIFYEKPVMNDSDIMTIEFRDHHFVYTSNFRTPIKTYSDVLMAIMEQMKELGWLDD